MKYLFLLFLFFSLVGSTISQSGLNRYFEKVELRIDTSAYSWAEDRIIVNGEDKLKFEYKENTSVAELRLFVRGGVTLANKVLSIQSSQDFEIIDSLSLIEDTYYQVKLKFADLSSTDFLAPIIRLTRNNNEVNVPLRLFPYTKTKAAIETDETDLFIGEQKTFEILTNRNHNILIDPKWKSTEKFDYRVFRSDDKILLAIIPSVTGTVTAEIELELRKPFLENNQPNYRLQLAPISFSVKGSRLSFLRFDMREIIWERSNKEGVEVQIDNHRLLQINKTYRVEATDEPGGPLIAELFTLRRISNDKVLCMFRPYNYHQSSDSYLFIKDGDEPRFITNLNILPEPKINRISMLRKGGTWVASNQVYPGETVEIRIEGESLNRSNFIFEGLEDVSADTILRNESVVHYNIHVPISIRQKSISIYNRGKKTGTTLDVMEYLRPRDFDFVTVEFGESPKVVNKITQPLLYNGTIGDVNIQFDGYFIDESDRIYGKQYLEIEVLVKNSNNILTERVLIDDIVVCPGEGSPRYFSYGEGVSNCMNLPVSINDYISNKTHSLDNWSKIELVIRHRKGFYDGRGYSQRVEIIKERNVVFDVDLTIPAGLLIKKIGVDGFPSLSGISLSMLAQFSFYKKGEIQRLRPYKIGAGFLAQNAFNFNPEAERDLGIVILGSVYPTRRERKFSFPLYAGFGYFLNEARFFYLIGPGVRINL